MMNNSAIEVADLTIRRGRHTVIPGMTVSIARGSITGLLGPSGCGKSTLIRAIAGIQAVESGTVNVLAGPSGSAANRRRVGYVTQSSSVYHDLTVAQNLRYFAALAGRDEASAVESLGQVGLTELSDALVGNLSGGQRTRVSLAAALLADPDVYLLDEPTVGLDPILRRDLWQLFGRLAADGRALLVSSHVMDEAGRCDRVLLMREGRLIADATPDQLRAETGHDDLERAFLALAERSGT